VIRVMSFWSILNYFHMARHANMTTKETRPTVAPIQ
jgi:hypothetical protein